MDVGGALSLSPRGCARRRVSERNRRRRLLARRLKVAPQGRMRGRCAIAARFYGLLWVSFPSSVSGQGR